jgi:hypothetical protein
MLNIVIVTTGDEGPAAFVFFVLLGLWFLATLLAMAPVNIMCALFSCEAREMMLRRWRRPHPAAEMVGLNR